MNLISLFVALFFSMNASLVRADVWHATETWNSYWENDYQEWVNKNLKTNIFTTDEGLLSGISTDCADALYDIRIQYSYEHSLPFVINAPEALHPKMKTFGNDTSMFDSIKNERTRVRAFIDYINDEEGTSTIFKDTFPVSIHEINSGILYLVEWSLFGKQERHSYILKGFNADRELLYYASDAPRKVRKLQIDTKYPRFSYGSAPFGFRRWRHPEHLLIPEKDIPASEGYSIEQYKLLEKVGKKQILKEIRKQLQN
ncbi:MAG: hypothetical protein H7281_00740 [Bacteriovorax sp.]|nr:hypothetical protein [Bacteriovorax sp.]